MKQCPRCKQTYSDDQLNFCLTDGEMLSGFVQEPPPNRYADDSPPTVVLEEARRTNPSNWPASPPSSPPAQWQQPLNAPQAPFISYPMTVSPDQTLAIISLVLGIASLTIGWCCYSGLLLAPAALITGFIAMSQVKKDPARYAGRGLAIGGMATGAFFLLAIIFIIVIYGAAIFLGSLS